MSSTRHRSFKEREKRQAVSNSKPMVEYQKIETAMWNSRNGHIARSFELSWSGSQATHASGGTDKDELPPGTRLTYEEWVRAVSRTWAVRDKRRRRWQKRRYCFVLAAEVGLSKHGKACLNNFCGSSDHGLIEVRSLPWGFLKLLLQTE